MSTGGGRSGFSAGGAGARSGRALARGLPHAFLNGCHGRDTGLRHCAGAGAIERAADVAAGSSRRRPATPAADRRPMPAAPPPNAAGARHRRRVPPSRKSRRRRRRRLTPSNASMAVSCASTIRPGRSRYCSSHAVGWACEAVPEDRAALEKEIGRLQNEVTSLTGQVASLTAEIAASRAPPPPTTAANRCRTTATPRSHCRRAITSRAHGLRRARLAPAGRHAGQSAEGRDAQELTRTHRAAPPVPGRLSAITASHRN